MFLLGISSLLYVASMVLIYLWLLKGSYLVLVNISICSVASVYSIFYMVYRIYKAKNTLKKNFVVQLFWGDSVERDESDRIMNHYGTFHFYINPIIFQIYQQLFIWSFLAILSETFYGIVFTRSYHHNHIPETAPLYWRDFMSEQEMLSCYIYIGVFLVNYLLFLVYGLYTIYITPTADIFHFKSTYYSNDLMMHLLWGLFYGYTGTKLEKKRSKYIPTNSDTLGINGTSVVNNNNTSKKTFEEYEREANIVVTDRHRKTIDQDDQSQQTSSSYNQNNNDDSDGDDDAYINSLLDSINKSSAGKGVMDYITNKEAVERYPLLHRDQVVTNMDDEEMDDGSISQGNAPNYDDETFPNVIIDQSIEYPNTNFGHSSSIMNNNDDIATTF